MSPILTFLLAALAVYIAYMQWSTNHYRLKYDLFEKRYQVYSTLRDFQRSVIGSGRVEQDKYIVYIEGVREARWLFGKNVFNYLHDDVSANALALQTAMSEMEGMPAGDQRTAIVKNQADIMKKLSAELERADAIFEPYLDVSRVVSVQGIKERWRTVFGLPIK